MHGWGEQGTQGGLGALGVGAQGLGEQGAQGGLLVGSARVRWEWRVVIRVEHAAAAPELPQQLLQPTLLDATPLARAGYSCYLLLRPALVLPALARWHQPPPPPPH